MNYTTKVCGIVEDHNVWLYQILKKKILYVKMHKIFITVIHFSICALLIRERPTSTSWLLDWLGKVEWAAETYY